MALHKLYDEDGEELRPRQIEETKERINREYWLSPRGILYKYRGGIESAYSKTSLHYEIGYDILKAKFGEKYADDCRDANAQLLRQGWIQIGVIGQYNLTEKEPTQSQINTLFDLGIKTLLTKENKAITVF